MIASLGFFLLLDNSPVQTWIWGAETPRAEEQMALVAFLTIATWLLATFLTQPEPEEHLRAFYRKIHPAGSGWKPIAAKEPDVVADRYLGYQILGALAASGIVYFTIPAVGLVIFQRFGEAGLCILGGLLCATIVSWVMKKIIP